MTRRFWLGVGVLFAFGGVASASGERPLLKSNHAEAMAKAMAVESLDELPVLSIGSFCFGSVGTF